MSSGDTSEAATSATESSSETSLVDDSVIDAPDWESGITKEDHKDVGKTMTRRILHYGPLIALFLIFFIGWTAVYLHLMWWPLTTVPAFIHLILFLFWNYSTLSNFFAASLIGGGYLPRGWKPNVDNCASRLQYCTECCGYKAPRSHHCSSCGRCVMKMDHHCPWINNCVGYRNQSHFLFFLASAVVGCLHATVIIIPSIYHAIHLRYYIEYGIDAPYVDLTLLSLGISLFACAFAFAVAIAVGVLLFIQVKVLCKNMTGVEEYIMMKAKHAREEDDELDLFVFPYNLGFKNNLREVFSSKRNGVWWPVRASCTQFSLSEEQLRQKAVKRERSRLVKVTAPFKGGYCASICLSPKVFICQPISAEPRVAVSEGEYWVVTRASRHWLYGQRGQDRASRGWFPRRVAVLVDEEDKKEQ